MNISFFTAPSLETLKSAITEWLQLQTYLTNPSLTDDDGTIETSARRQQALTLFLANTRPTNYAITRDYLKILEVLVAKEYAADSLAADMLLERIAEYLFSSHARLPVEEKNTTQATLFWVLQKYNHLILEYQTSIQHYAEEQPRVVHEIKTLLDKLRHIQQNSTAETQEDLQVATILTAACEDFLGALYQFVPISEIKPYDFAEHPNLHAWRTAFSAYYTLSMERRYGELIMLYNNSTKVPLCLLSIKKRVIDLIAEAQHICSHNVLIPEQTQFLQNLAQSIMDFREIHIEPRLQGYTTYTLTDDAIAVTQMEALEKAG